MPRSSQWSLSFRFPHQDPIHPSLLTHTRHMPSPSHSNLFIVNLQYIFTSTQHYLLNFNITYIITLLHVSTLTSHLQA
jgi:hypothetical protein